jgi:mannan endo-1,4-beta-mannosidase
MNKYLLTLSSIILAFLITSCSSLFLQSNREFVKVNGTHFEIGGVPYYFTGTNLWYGCYLGSPDKTGDRERLKRELDKLKSLGITNMRILGASEESYITNSLRPAMQIKPGVYNENLLKGLDFLLVEMNKRNMHAVIFLNNYWEWTGGMSQYNDWANGGGGVDPANNNFSNFMDYSATFYGNQKAQNQYLDHVKKIVTRKNSISGILYSDDPTIMAWQLANEPRPGRNRLWLEKYYIWIASAAYYIHSIDKRHLVSTGNEGLAGSLEDSLIYLTAHRSKEIDYLTFHLWPKNWGWFDAKNISNTYQKTENNAIEYINKHIAFADSLNKPIVLEEFGLPRDSEFCKPTSLTSARDRYYKKILTLIYDSSAAGAPIAGTNVWAWGGEGRGQHPDDKWLPGDQFVGDPPQEPQGFNSIYDSDSTTISILRDNAGKMESLNEKHSIDIERR